MSKEYRYQISNFPAKPVALQSRLDIYLMEASSTLCLLAKTVNLYERIFVYIADIFLCFQTPDEDIYLWVPATSWEWNTYYIYLDFHEK